MASMRDIKRRKTSIQGTQQITKAMKLVSTVKLQRARAGAERSQTYFDCMYDTVNNILSRVGHLEHKYLVPGACPKKAVIVITSNRGLAGGYNANLFKAFSAHAEGTDACVLPLGRKAIERCHRLGLTMLTDDYPRVEGMSVGTCYHLARLLLDGYDAERYDELWLVYTNFVSMMTQEVMIEQLLPVQRPPEGAPHKLVSTVYELPPAETLAQVLPDFLAGRLYSALCDAFASEVAARRSAMDSATKNAGEMISDLKLRYNRARQGAITQEITEIVAGAEH